MLPLGHKRGNVLCDLLLTFGHQIIIPLLLLVHLFLNPPFLVPLPGQILLHHHPTLFDLHAHRPLPLIQVILLLFTHHLLEKLDLLFHVLVLAEKWVLLEFLLISLRLDLVEEGVDFLFVRWFEWLGVGGHVVADWENERLEFGFVHVDVECDVLLEQR